MKTRFKHNIEGLTGKLDGLVYYYHPGRQDIFARKYVPATSNPMADRYREIMANLKLLNPSSGYKQNFKDYLILYNGLRENRENQLSSWSNLYLKMLFALAKQNPEIDLATLSRQQIFDENLPCKNVKAAIENGLLPMVKLYEMFVNDI